MLHAFLQDAVVRDGRVEELLVATKAGLARVARHASSSMPAATPTSATTPASATSWPARRRRAQTLTTTFKMVNVDLARRRQISTAEVHERMAEAAASGDYDLPRREGSDHITPIEGMIATVMTRRSPRSASGTACSSTPPTRRS